MIVPLRSPMPPHYVFRDFLDKERKVELLEYSLTRRSQFHPSSLGDGTVDPNRRVSERLLELTQIRRWFEILIRERAQELFAQTGVPPFEIEYVELEIAAHGHGAHFAAHTDIPVGWGRTPLGGDSSGTQDRLLSAVYYFHHIPKSFSGGELRLHRFDSKGNTGDYVDIPPDDNTLVVFPSWVVHEVLKVDCPSNVFEDYRFAINCWLCRKLPA